ncbi:uncharacterized protein LOC130825925 [Amaranthus tricolor]|uniref:uncharacterized protein LOC130825925 n=1 Tax=Amaranthus tricolor TaxID=29722 RepID=UPI00258F7783|nr:uncharacterized protein LOC130825925 [Amaranthus tricolor]
MFHHHHQSHNVNSNIDIYSTPIRGESLDENEMEYDDDEEDENEGNDQDDQYGKDGGNSVHHFDASLYTQPLFQHYNQGFRMRKHVFLRIMEAVSNNDPWFTPNIDATGRKAYGVAADQVDEYLRISESTARKALTHFTKGIINQFGQHYLRKPTPQDLTRLLAFSEERGFPGMIGSVDCMHWEWKNCPAAWKGQYQGRAGVATLILEAVADHDLWIWHAFFGMPGSYNDLNVLYRSPLLVDLFEGRAPPVNFTVNGNQYGMAYYLTDGIYPKWATFIQFITEPQTAKARLFAQHQEAARKDVERAFGVLQARFAIIRKPSLAWDEERLFDIITSCIIMHNMIVEDERDTYTHYADGREFMGDRPKGQSDDTSGLNDDFEYYTDRILISIDNWQIRMMLKIDKHIYP